MENIKRNIGIDVVKGLALISVIIYHLYEYKATYIGVIVFFVISGYFISSVLVEREESYFSFLKRRFFKIYPLLIVVLTAVFFIFCSLNDFLTLKMIRSSLFTLLGLSNIYQIKTGMSYFDRSGDMYPLLHTWSLAIEIQFYLFFPFLIKFVKKAKLDKIKASYFMLSLSFLSAFIMFLKMSNFKDISTIYYGTETRLFSLFMGSTYYFYFKDEEINKEMFKKLAYVSIGIITLSTFYFTYDMEINYYGLLHFLSFLSGIIVIANVKADFLNGKSQVLKVLSILGKHSYCYYLWQYPLMVFFREYFKWTDIKYNYTVIIQLLILVIFAEISYEFLEKREVMAKKIGKVASIVYIFSLFFLPVSQETNSQILQDRIAEINIENTIKNVEKTASLEIDLLEKRLLESEKNKNEEKVIEVKQAENISETKTSNLKEKTPKKEEMLSKVKHNKYIFIGDSVMKMGETLIKEKFENSYVDAKVSRQFVDLPKLLKELLREGKLADKVIVHLGTNGVINKKAFEDTMNLLKDKEVYFMNCVVPKFWEESVNKNLRTWSKEYPNVKIIDWHKYAKGKKVIFYKDATHLTKDGAKKYVDYIYSIVEN